MITYVILGYEPNELDLYSIPQMVADKGIEPLFKAYEASTLKPLC